MLSRAGTSHEKAWAGAAGEVQQGRCRALYPVELVDRPPPRSDLCSKGWDTGDPRAVTGSLGDAGRIGCFHKTIIIF